MNYYVYTFAYADGTVFYVGKGQGEGCMSRIRIHLYMAVGKRTEVTPVVEVIRAIWRSGGKLVIRKPYSYLIEKEALELEQSLIAFYGYEQLVNRPPQDKGAFRRAKQLNDRLAAPQEVSA